jgi:MFS family permease
MPDDATTAPALREQEPAGLKQAIAQQFSLQAAIGGPRGLAESILPMTVFSIVWAFTHDVPRSVLAALVPSVVLAIWRIVAREPLTQALSGVLGIALGAGIALYTGRAQDFFIPGILKNVGFGALYAISALVRWPLVGVLLGFMLGEDLNWRRVRPRMRVYQQATWLWVGVFALRAAVQGWLYATGQATALGFVNVLLGLPLFGLAVALTWVLVRRVPVAKPQPKPEEEPEEDERVRAEAARD